MVSQVVKITNPTGLHLSAAGNLCSEAMKYKAQITFEHNGDIANAKSVLSVLGSSVRFGDEIILRCDGEDEASALEHLVSFIHAGLEY